MLGILPRNSSYFNASDNCVTVSNLLRGSISSQGGDGFFNEILNGLLCLRHKPPNPPAPAEFVESLGDSIDSFIANASERIPEISSKNEDQSPLILTNGSHFSSLSMCTH